MLFDPQQTIMRFSEIKKRYKVILFDPLTSILHHCKATLFPNYSRYMLKLCQKKPLLVV